MLKIFTLLRFDLKCLTRPGAVFVLLAPLVIAVSVYFSLPEELFIGGSFEPFGIAVSDNGDDMATQLILSTVGGLDLIGDVRIVDRDRGLTLLEAGYVAAFVDIPPGLEGSLIHNIPAEIRIYGGRDYPIQSTILRAVAESAASGVSAVQSNIYVFNELERPFFEEPSDFFAARNRLAIDLMFLSLGRNRAVEVLEPAASGYLAHLVAVVAFFSAGVAAVYVSINTAIQHKSRIVASMRMAGIGFGAFAASKCIQTILFAVVAIVPLLIFAEFSGFGGFSPFRLVLGIFALAVLFSLPCLLFSLLFKNHAQTALCGFGFLFCMLFIGGAFPAHLTGDFFAAVSQFSPSTLASDFAAWSVGGALTATVVLPFVVSAAFVLPTRMRFLLQS